MPARSVMARLEGLHDAFLEELFEAGAEFFRFGGARVGDKSEDLGREARDFVVSDRFVLGERVADAERVVADEANDVAGPGDIDGLSLLAEKFLRGREAHGAASALVDDGHVALEFAGADANEGDAVAVLRVHVRLNLEDEGGELRVLDGDGPIFDFRFRIGD